VPWAFVIALALGARLPRAHPRARASRHRRRASMVATAWATIGSIPSAAVLWITAIVGRRDLQAHSPSWIDSRRRASDSSSRACTCARTACRTCATELVVSHLASRPRRAASRQCGFVPVMLVWLVVVRHSQIHKEPPSTTVMPRS
jgi:hypothetical protein